MANNYEQRKQARIDRYKELAVKNQEIADERYNTAHKMAECIPFGQPIIVGHHSEKGDRAFRNKIHNNYKKSFEAMDKAKYYREKVLAAETNTAISSDNPDALDLLKKKLSDLERKQELMKTVNKIIRNKKKTEDVKTKEIMDLGFAEENAKKMFEPDFCGRIGFADYQLTNNNANIRRLKERIKDLERKQNDTTTEVTINGVRIVDNVEDNRLQLFFDGKPPEEVRTNLKKYGFKWSRYNGCWQRFRSGNANYYAKLVVNQM